MTHLKKAKPASLSTDRRESSALSGELIERTPRGHIALLTIGDIRHEMARVYRQARSKAMDTSEASKLIYMLAQLGKVAELELIEGRIRRLEDRANEL